MQPFGFHLSLVSIRPYDTMKKLLLLSFLFTLGFQSISCENVALTFLFNPSIAPGVITYTLENSNGGIETYNVEINPNGYGTASVCLPNSCFELGFVYNIIQPGDVYSVTYSSNSVTSVWTPNFSDNGAIENPLTFCVESQACSLGADAITELCGQATIVATSSAPNALYNYYIDGQFYTSGESVLTLDNLAIGEHTYCVTSTADICNDQEACGSFVVQSCDCPSELVVNMLNDCLAIFHPELFEPEAFVLYYVNGEQVSNGEPIFTYQFSGSGEFEVCMESCEEMYCQTFMIDGCLDDCPTETFAQGDGCSWQFEIGSFSPGESVIWNFGDGTEVVGGHYIQHEYEASGEYVVTANYTSNACPNGTSFTFIATADGCPNECNPTLGYSNDDCSYTFSLTPEAGWVDQIYWTVNNDFFVGSSTMTFEFLDAGVYVVCAESFNSICEQGFSICATVESSGCAPDCTPYLFHLDAPVEPGAIQVIYWQVSDANGMVAAGTQTFLNDTPAFVEDFCLPDGCYSIILQSSQPIANTQAWMSNANGEVPWSSDPMWDSMSALLEFGVNTDCNETVGCSLELEYYQTENGNNFFTAYPSVDGTEVDWFLDGVFYETGNVVDGSFEAGIHEMCAVFETPDCPEGVTQCLTFVILGLPECSEVLINIDPQGIPGLDLDFEFQLESMFDQIPWEFDGALTIYEETDGTFIGICLPDGCYTLSMTMDEFLQFGILINILVEGGLDVNYVIDPLTQTVGLEFGVNNNCENDITEVENENISVYPSPSSGILNLSQTSNSPLSWQVYDLSGRMVLLGSNLSGASTINASELSNGHYLLKLQMNETLSIHPFQIFK